MICKRTAAVALAVTLALGLAVAASAQGFGGRFGGGFGGPLGGSPIMSDPMGLLMRPEVQNEIHLDLKQKNAIADLMDQSQADRQQRMRQTLQGIDRRGLGNLSPEERQQRMAEIQAQMQAAMNVFQGELNDKIKTILKPDQITRLHQLDLQRRGPLSMADPKVAEEVKLTPEHRTEVGKIFNQHQQETQKVMQDAFQQMRAQIQQNGGIQPGQPPALPDFTSKQSPLRRKIDKSKSDAEEQVLALLSDDERANWKQAIGVPFKFRPDPPMQNNVGRAGGF
jgi:hypothetical protein